MTSFRHLKAVIRLFELVEEPIDLTVEGVLTPKRIDAMIAEAVNWKMFYATERVSDVTISALFDLANEMQAVKKMEEMQAGTVVNFIEGYESEKRSALHTAMRDFFDQRSTAKAAQEATTLAYQELEKLRAFLDEIEKTGRFTDLVQIGIGGSELGPKAVYVALEAFHKPERRVHFLSNVDPDDGAQIFRKVDLDKTLFVVVSKSGSTLETLTNEQYVKEHLKKAGLNPKDHLVTVTGKGSPMDDPSQYIGSFYIWDYIGGRYSVTSMVGGVALAFALGMDRFIEFLRGASAMDKAALKKDPKANLPLLGALLGIWNRNFLGLPTSAIIPYSQALASFPAHLQQLDMESNGKRIDKRGNAVDFDTGPIIWGEIGTNGQHSFYQSIHQGTTIVPLEIIGFKKNQYSDDVIYDGTSSQEKLLSNLFAQSLAFAVGQKNENPNKFFPGNRPNRILLSNRLDPFSMGALLAYFEHKVVFQGFMWNINSFDQEGVRLGKTLALRFIEQFSLKRQGKPFDAKGFPIGASFLRHLE
ncbi:MAG TPA: glucose-6-phosphate isomerase [Rhabdochlamydiaceae bacterium]|nr:glucose-6-phosphate isomerase [Rhabdochlamydiaceae bacterium]